MSRILAHAALVVSLAFGVVFGAANSALAQVQNVRICPSGYFPANDLGGKRCVRGRAPGSSWGWVGGGLGIIATDYSVNTLSQETFHQFDLLSDTWAGLASNGFHGHIDFGADTILGN
jgi:hypothetical protein